MIQKKKSNITILFFTVFLAGCSPTANEDQLSVDDAPIEEVVQTKSTVGLPPYASDSNSQYNIAMTYVETQDYINAFEWFNRAADQGNAKAQHMLCGMYLEGIGINQDYEKALDLCKKSASQGDVNAQDLMGLIYYEGRVVDQDYFEALEWFNKAADQGSDDSQLKLCTMYAEGQGVRQDQSKAFEWCKKSSAEGNIYAGFNLGLMYLTGQGVIQDTSTAKDLFGTACDNGIQEGCDQYKRLNFDNTQHAVQFYPS